MSKLGLHVNSWQPGVLDYVLQSRPRLLKSLDVNDNLRIVKDQLPNCTIIYRSWRDEPTQSALLADPRAGALRFRDDICSTIGNYAPYIDYVEGLNETGLWNQADRYDEWTAEYARLMHGEGHKTIAYNFSVGCPQGYFQGDGDLYPDLFKEGLAAYWGHYYNGLRESDGLGCHEYSAPRMADKSTWLCLRYRRVYDLLPADLKSKPLFITETGIDGGVIAGQLGGFKKYISEDVYLDDLKWYDSEIKKDPYVVGATIFCCGTADPFWDSFDILGANSIRDYIANDMEEPTNMDEAKIQQLLDQNALLTQALIAFRQGKFTGADGIDGIIVALTGQPLTFTPSYPKA